MHKFSLTLLYNVEKFCTLKTELPNFKIILPLPKLNFIRGRLESKGLMFFGDIPVDIQPLTFFL